ncbi:unnamed protein product [Phyllotreta striolata]|uniref:Ubiquinol-cytochrome c chaperone domain-containing protein n=1 Tax=Phyllotreta striolata TaxID=444603 RepID=A0A9N9XNV6_PHYSR|nr:unnamed protein product [Phyllotreta striolata]
MNISKIVFNTLKPAVVKTQRNGSKLAYNARSLNPSVIYRNQISLVSTYEVKNVQKDGIIRNMLKKIPFLKLNEMKIKARGYILYEEIADKIDYVEFFKEFDLPDTFNSWFSVTELHIWMLSLRIVADGEDGKILRNSIVEALWTDVAQRVKRLGVITSSGTRNQIMEMSEQMQASFISYDEGIQSDDKVLAAAVWRRLYGMNHANLQNIEKLVKYIRKQVAILDTLPHEVLFQKGSIHWESFKS